MDMEKIIYKTSSITAICFEGSASDLEFADMDGVILIPKFVADEAAKEDVKGKSETCKHEVQHLWQDDRPLQLSMRHLGLDSFEFGPIGG